jgi:hypothetical protein
VRCAAWRNRCARPKRSPTFWLAAYRALIDEGYALSFREGLRLERARVETWNRKVTAVRTL